MTQTGQAVYEKRKGLKISRRALVDQFGEPWTTGRLSDIEQGKREIRNDEVAAVEGFLGQPVPYSDVIKRGKYAVAANGSEHVVAPPTYAPDQVVASTEGAWVSPIESDVDAVIWLPFDDRLEEHYVTAGPPVAPQQPVLVDPSPASPDTPVERRVAPEIERSIVQVAQDSYRLVSFRLRGQPAPYPWPVPGRGPEDLDANQARDVLTWCENVNAYLDDVTGGMLSVAGTSAGVEPPQGVPQPPAVSAPEEVSVPAAAGSLIPGSAAAPSQLDTAPAASEQSAAPTGTAVGVAALNDKGLRRLTNSEIQTYKHCRRRWWLSWFRGLKLRNEEDTGPRQLGTRIHDALAEWYVPAGQTPTHPLEALETILAADELEMIRSSGDVSGDALAEKLSAFQKEADLARAMVEGYMQWIAETGADSDYEVIGSEMVLGMDLKCSDSLTVSVQGKLDVRVRRAHDGVILFFDHKTVGDFKTPATTLPMNEQMKQYHLLEVENRENPNDRVEGALYNMLRRVKRSANAKPPFYERLELRPTTTTIARFKERLRGEALAINHTEQMLNQGISHQTVAFPSPSSRCSWGCEFKAVCTMFDDGSRAEDFISEHYVSINPLDRYDADAVKGVVPE